LRQLLPLPLPLPMMLLLLLPPLMSPLRSLPQ
jgi:hypothetical protein